MPEEITVGIDDELRRTIFALHNVIKQQGADIMDLRIRLTVAERALREFRKDFDSHDRYGDFCPHTGR